MNMKRLVTKYLERYMKREPKYFPIIIRVLTKMKYVLNRGRMMMMYGLLLHLKLFYFC